ncbi:hypothetical protein B0H19DRAFT_1167750, partial [Mycena capillaripes]
MIFASHHLPTLSLIYLLFTFVLPPSMLAFTLAIPPLFCSPSSSLRRARRFPSLYYSFAWTRHFDAPPLPPPSSFTLLCLHSGPRSSSLLLALPLNRLLFTCSSIRPSPTLLQHHRRCEQDRDKQIKYYRLYVRPRACRTAGSAQDGEHDSGGEAEV